MRTFQVVLTSPTSSRCRAGVKFFCLDILKHGLNQTQVGDELLELAVLVLQLLQPPHLDGQQAPTCFLRQMYNVASLTPTFWRNSPIAVRSSVCFSTKAVSAIESIGFVIRFLCLPTRS